MDSKTIDLIRSNDHLTLSRVISEIESNSDISNEFFNEIYSLSHNSIRIGVTGPPGAGKSTLTNQIIKYFLTDNKSVGIIAIDPTSPFTGGALLGDRVRMNQYLFNDNVFIRRMGSRGEFGGLGIEVTQENGFIKVVSPIDDTPAANAGIEAGDFITKVDGESTLGKTLDEAVDKMRGPVGSEIIITVVREGVDEPFDVSIIRDTIEIKAVKARTEGKTIVLRVSSFTSKTYPNLKDSLEKEIKAAGGLENVNGVVVDLRNNPGGLLNQAIRVSDAFLESGEIVSTRGRAAGDAERYNATPGDLTNGKPVVVLINGGSASASEIVAGALQDHHRAIIVGTKSFGKGSVQTIIPLSSDGAAMRLTTARYYTPSGRSIQSLGVSPDILVKQRVRSDEDPEKDQNFQRFEADLENSLSSL